jgi:lipopolysaccharide export system protein LptA
MACKFHAAMRKARLLPPLPALRSGLVRFGLAAAVALAGPSARAEKADRFKPLNVEADQPGRIDLLNQHVVFNGNVVVTKGTMVIRAARIEVRESPDGYHSAVAVGAPNRPATFRQKRDGVDEYIEGEAERLEYDGKADTIRFVNNASVRRLRGATMADEISGNLISYDSITEVFSVSGGATSTPANPGGRVRAVLTPREGSAAAAEAAAAASRPVAPLKSSPALGERK